MNKPLVLLQNAWSRAYAGDIWPRGSWLLALHRSRSGQRLKVAFPDPDAIHYDNTTPQVGEEPSSILPPDYDHLLKLFAADPPYVVAGGLQAGKVAQEMWAGRLILMPHPAYRLVTDELFRLVGITARGGDFHRVRFIQAKGSVIREPIPERNRP